MKWVPNWCRSLRAESRLKRGEKRCFDFPHIQSHDNLKGREREKKKEPTFSSSIRF
jgi:hypothetical protein